MLRRWRIFLVFWLRPCSFTTVAALLSLSFSLSLSRLDSVCTIINIILSEAGAWESLSLCDVVGAREPLSWCRVEEGGPMLRRR